MKHSVLNNSGYDETQPGEGEEESGAVEAAAQAGSDDEVGDDAGASEPSPDAE